MHTPATALNYFLSKIEENPRITPAFKGVIAPDGRVAKFKEGAVAPVFKTPPSSGINPLSEALAMLEDLDEVFYAEEDMTGLIAIKADHPVIGRMREFLQKHGSKSA